MVLVWWSVLVNNWCIIIIIVDIKMSFNISPKFKSKCSICQFEKYFKSLQFPCCFVRQPGWWNGEEERKRPRGKIKSILYHMFPLPLILNILHLKTTQLDYTFFRESTKCVFKQRILEKWQSVNFIMETCGLWDKTRLSR